MSEKSNPKFIFVVGGVISGVGKGVTTSSIAKIMQDRGLRVTAIKVDPYVNVDAGTMNPTEHGEVFVLDDGYETDQDMGNYERFLNTDLSNINYMTTGRVYLSVIERERNLEYKGKCVQVVPHIPMEVIRRIKKAAKEAQADVCVIEIGGTIGEYESVLYLEAARMMKIKNPDSVMFVMVSYLPAPQTVGEMKTKPTQHAVRVMNASGVSPDVIIARSSDPLDEKRKEKISFFCNIPKENVISAPDIKSIYDVPVNFEKERLGDRIAKMLDLPGQRKEPPSFTAWKQFAAKVHNGNGEVRIAVVGKYFETGDFVLSDAYISVIEAIKYSAYTVGKKPVLSWLSAKDFEDKKKLQELDQYDGILVPGGFGETGIDGKLAVIEYARTKKIPYFGICYGMQLMVVEYARNVAGLSGAHTEEIDPKTPYPVVHIMKEQKAKLAAKDYGGSMRLGAYTAVLKKGSIAEKAYGKETISERHRHRYEINNQFVPDLEKAGLVFSGRSPERDLMEIAELPKEEHPFFLGAQFHPEFKARPLAPHPLFTAFVKASIKNASR